MIHTQKLGYIALGGVLTLVGLAVRLCVSPLTAQRDTFGDITCTGLTVVDKGSKRRVIVVVNELGGFVGVLGKDDRTGVTLFANEEYGGSVAVFGNDGKPAVNLDVNEYGHGLVATLDKNGYRLK